MREPNRFLRENRGNEIVSVDDDRIFVIDQYLKQVMDGLVQHGGEGIRQLLAACSGSPLKALAAILYDSEQNVYAGTLPPFIQVIYDRILNDLSLKEEFLNGSGAVKARVAAELRRRGLMK
jgi:hypothetical protein